MKFSNRAILTWKALYASCSFGEGSTTCQDDIVDFVIVGCGFSGIAAARKLEEFNSVAGKSYTYKIIEMNDECGGRGVAAGWLSGDENPLLAFLEAGDYDVENFDDLLMFKNEGTPTEKYSQGEISSVQTAFVDALACVGERADDFGAGLMKDESLRDAFSECGWDPVPGSIEDTYEWYEVDFSLAQSPENSGLYNLEIEASVDDVGPGFNFLKTPRKAASIADLMVDDPNYNIRANVLTSTEVKLIDWSRRKPRVHILPTELVEDDCPCVPGPCTGCHPLTTGGVCKNPHQTVCWDLLPWGVCPTLTYLCDPCASHDCSSLQCVIKAKRVLVTTSLGVIDKRGDCKYVTGSRAGCDPEEEDLPMYKPILPRWKTRALRKTYINKNLNVPTMGEYREIRLQFGPNIWSMMDPSERWITVDNPAGNGLFTVFQNFDIPGLNLGSRALVTTMATEEYDALTGTTRTFADPAGTVNQLLADTLGNAYGINSFSCTETDPLPFPDSPPTSADECVFSYFPGENEEWYGAYSSWRVSNGFNDVFDGFFDDTFDVLTRRGVYNVWFSGAAYCDEHSEFVHGAYWSGGLAMNEMLDDLGEQVYENGSPIALDQTDEWVKCFGV